MAGNCYDKIVVDQTAAYNAGKATGSNNFRMVLRINVQLLNAMYHATPTAQVGAGSVDITVTRQNGTTSITGLPSGALAQYSDSHNTVYRYGVNITSVSLISFTLL